MSNNNLPIGVFDSGVGGLTVAREIFRNLPNERIIYYGDTARVPYGNKSPETIIRYSRQIARHLVSCGVKAIVIACNTASAIALDSVREIIDIPVIGVVEPGARAAVCETVSGRIGIIGTSATISSGIYDRYIKELLPDAQVSGKACPLFVPLVEEGILDDPVTVQMIHRYLDGMIREDRIDTLILGCTHYPWLRSVIAREIGGVYAGYQGHGTVDHIGLANHISLTEHTKFAANADHTEHSDVSSIALEDSKNDLLKDSSTKIKLVNPAYTTAMELKEMLEESGLSADPSSMPSVHRFIVSDGPDSFSSFASRMLEMEIADVSLTVLE